MFAVTFCMTVCVCESIVPTSSADVKVVEIQYAVLGY